MLIRVNFTSGVCITRMFSVSPWDVLCIHHFFHPPVTLRTTAPNSFLSHGCPSYGGCLSSGLIVSVPRQKVKGKL